MRLTSWENKGLAWGEPAELTGLQNCIKNMKDKNKKTKQQQKKTRENKGNSNRNPSMISSRCLSHLDVIWNGSGLLETSD